jgi:pyrimidine-nucleoside phosphorylase
MTEVLHAVDIIRKKRDGHALNHAEIGFMVTGAAQSSLPDEQLAAWLMACFLRGMDTAELASLTMQMRDSGEKRAKTNGPAKAVDKHSTGGVGDKTSFLVAPIAAAAGVIVPMISGRALGHTGGTLDKLDSLPGYDTQLSLSRMDEVVAKAGATIVGQTLNLVPADRVLYLLRDRTGTVESPHLICASIMSKKLAAGLDALVLDVKTGSGAFLKDVEQARHLASLMVKTGEAAGTRTVALLTDMNQPLGRFAGNWIEIAECVELMQGKRDHLSEDLRELSLVLAGWMIYLGGKTADAQTGRAVAEDMLMSGAALDRFRSMVAAQGGDIGWLNSPFANHKPKASRQVLASRGGFVTEVDCEQVGWAVQRLGAGREKAGEPVAPMAGIEVHWKLGDTVEAGAVLYTMFADNAARFAEPERLLTAATRIGDVALPARPLVLEVIGS